MAKANENISALMSITKKDRESVIRALNQVTKKEMLHYCLYSLHTSIYDTCLILSVPEVQKTQPICAIYIVHSGLFSKVDKKIDCT